MPASPPTDVLLRVRGTVQGVGYRPFVHRTATGLGLRGWVRNDGSGVLVRAAGAPGRIADLVTALTIQAPAAASVAAVERLPLSGDTPGPGDAFAIVASIRDGRATTAVPPDLALCGDCRRELLDPSNRRFGYPFINCTQCGPRYSLIEQLPYDRPHTTMRAFPLCPACAREYGDPADRRFHAEPNACAECGPQATLRDREGGFLAGRAPALRQTQELLRAGRIAAVKGVGGFHLMCDATQATAVATLRARKHRDDKPLAVMFRDLAQLAAHAEVPAAAAELLASAAAPIVLVPRRTVAAAGFAPLAPGVAPGNPWIGALLPYSPLHVLLLDGLDFPLVATSANLAEEPLCSDNAEARHRLAEIADFFLEHDRPIARPVDDSVVRLTARGAPILLRRARGFAPAPLTLPRRLPGHLLCVGGHLKNTVAVAADDQVTVSPHLGDLDSAPARTAFTRTITTLSQLYRTDFTVVAHDKHPGYASTAHAATLGLPLIAVQHHLAHVLACLLEHGHPADNVLGIAWDGTGWGEDGTVWGGEFILLRRNRAERFARLRPFRLAGSEAAVRDARRIALALVRDADPAADLAARLRLNRTEAEAFATILQSGLNSPLCSSAGRMFDGFAALLGCGDCNRYEGQLPLALERTALLAGRDHAVLHFPVEPSPTSRAHWEIDWRPAVQQVLGHPPDAPRLAAACHRGLARAIVNVATQAGVGTVALTGGCFQNALLHSLTSDALQAAGFRVLVHRHLSPNDNSIAAGQALAALLQLTTVNCPS
jgi:hydrogenase maturation protein HypF